MGRSLAYTVIWPRRVHAEQERRQAEEERRHAEEERLRANESERQHLAAEARAERLLARLRALGLEEEAG